MSEDELCIDYYGDKGNPKKCRYWLSRLLMPFRVVKSFGLLLRPYELNVKYSIAGNDFFLYDTEEEAEVNYSPENLSRQFFYLYGTPYVDTNPLKWEIDGLKKLVSFKQEELNRWKKRAKIFSVIIVLGVVSILMGFLIVYIL
jgi:hypothetical protein